MNVRLWDTLSSPFKHDDGRNITGWMPPADSPLLAHEQNRGPIADGLTFVESLSFEQIERYHSAWASLVERAIEPNVFMEPSFVLSASLHASVTARPEFIVVWMGVDFEPRARMIGLWMINRRNAMLSSGVDRVWLHKHSALGAPLIDTLAAHRSVGALIAWFDMRSTRSAALSISRLTRQGALFELLISHCQTQGRDWRVVNEHDRAILISGRDGIALSQPMFSTKHRRELQRQRRRLMELGRLDNYSATTPPDVREAMEKFLALEAMSWKGKRKTALLSEASDAAFARSMTRLLARESKCRIDWLALDQTPIAMAIILSSGGRGYFWKTTYDEALAQYSPGVQLASSLTERQLEMADVDLTDSCAIPDHPMIDRVWPDRQSMADLLISVGPTQASAFPRIARRERFWRDMRAVVKTAAYSALGRQRS